MQTGDEQHDKGDHADDESQDTATLEQQSRSIARSQTQQDESPSYERSRQAAALSWLNTKVNWLVVFNLIVAASTAAQTYFSYRALREVARSNSMTRDLVISAQTQADAAKTQADAATNSLIAGNRAWAHPVRPNLYLDIGQRIRVSVEITNSGHSPAMEYKQTARAVILKSKADLNFTYPEYPEGSTALLAPGTTGFIGVETERIADAALIRNLRTRRELYFVYGQLTYRDIFNQLRRTTFCYEMSERLTLVQCSSYNNAD